MKKILLVAIVGMVSFSAMSQGKGGETNINGGLELGLPMGNFGTNAGIGLGASLKAVFGGTSGFTASAGYMTFAGKTVGSGIGSYTTTASNLIPVKVGYRMASEGGFYFEPQVGMTFYTGGSGFTYAPSVGYTTGSLDLSARYEAISQTGATSSFVGVRLAYSFGGGK